MTLTVADFPDFFKAIHGYTPHPWQVRLATQVCRNGWPDLLDLPTGSGKTAALDIAVFAMAVKPKAQPRRIVFVVDRRLIVDQVSERAEKLQEALQEARVSDPQSTLGSVAISLSAASGSDQVLGTSTLRGGLRDSEWARSPHVPWIISSTVDQVGSRLLFRGYGVSNSMRPVHAGLLGNDTLFLLDEVHLSRPFAETLREIASRHRPTTSISRPWSIVEMSATPGADVQDRFALDDDDLDPGSLLHRIVSANKPATLEIVGKKRDKDHATSIASEATSLVEGLGEVDSIAFVVNRVATARSVAAVLRKDGYKPLLLTGRMRPHDRDGVTNSSVFKAVRNDGNSAAGKRPIIVATQTIEVGADLDFGGLITECAPVDSLRQRFGRLDRSGRRSAEGLPVAARIVIPASLESDAKPAADPVYGDGKIQSVWQWLADRIDIEDDSLDVGSMSPDLADPPIEVLTVQKHAPLLLASHSDAFVQTSPSPTHSPNVAKFLHGDDDLDTDVQIAWRIDIEDADLAALNDMSPDDRTQAVDEYLAVCPVNAAEQMSVPIRAASRWMNGRKPTIVADISTSSNDDPDEYTHHSKRRLLRINRDTIDVVTGSDLNPGDSLVAPASWGGIEEGTWSPDSDRAVDDVGGLQTRLNEDIPVVRLIDAWFKDLPVLREFDAETGINQVDTLKAWLESHPPNSRTELLATALSADPEVFTYRSASGRTRYAVRSRTARTNVEFDGSDRNSSTGVKVSLDSHLAGVGAKARFFAERCALDSALCDDFELAGRLHDLGKLDPRFQIRLHGNDILAAALSKQPLAKSANLFRTTDSHLRSIDRYPRGHRHELLSVAIMEQYPELTKSANNPDLVRYLVASHHGHNRPFVPPQIDPLPQPIKQRVLGIEIGGDTSLPEHIVDIRSADLFWRMVDQWGHYGLAWLEAIFRLADHRRSEDEANDRN